MSEYIKVPALLMRGGTSKGLYMLMQDLPQDPALRDQAILYIYGTPDVRQINGVGGADPLTSKVALIEASKRPDIDVDYTFGYVGIDVASIDYDGNCGNMSAGVGPFAILTGLVKAQEPVTTVRIYNTNTNKVIEAQVLVKNGEPVTKGDYKIAGVPGSGSKIVLNFPNSGGSKTGKLLPTGNVVDELTLTSGQKIRASLVDAANPAVFVQAADLGLTGTELPQEAQANPHILELMEDVRTSGAVLMGLAASKAAVSPAVPKVAIVAAPQTYMASDNQEIAMSDVDLVARTLALSVMHKTYAVTGGICLATAALINGTVVNELVSETAKKCGEVRIGHPSGVLEVFVDLNQTEQGWILNKAGVCRTAKPIMQGVVYVPNELFE